MTEKFNVPRDQILGVVQYPQGGDPLANGIALWEAGGEARVTEFDLHTLEVLEEYHLPMSPRGLATLLQLGNVDPLDPVDEPPHGPIWGGPDADLVNPSSFRESSDGEKWERD